MNEAMIFSPGSTLRDVPPDFHGISLREYYRRDVILQCSAYLKTQEGIEPEINRKPIQKYSKHKPAKDNQ